MNRNTTIPAILIGIFATLALWTVRGQSFYMPHGLVWFYINTMFVLWSAGFMVVIGNLYATAMDEIDEIEPWNEHDEYSFTVNGREHFFEEDIIVLFFKEGIVFLTPSARLMVLCSDTFEWATVDGEILTHDQIGPLYKAYKADNIYGSTKWVCQRRQMQPQRPLIEQMKKAGAWDEEMENLPRNPHS